MVFRDQSAKTFSRIAQALKVSQHDERPLAHIVQIVREHFHAESCSLYEFRKEALTLVAMDQQDPSLGKMEPSIQQEVMKLVVRNKEAVFTQGHATVPLVYREKIVGVLMLQKSQSNGF